MSQLPTRVSESVRKRNPGLYSQGSQYPTSERDLHCEISDECRRRGFICFHGSMAEATHRTLGEPDYICLLPDGRFLMVECKSRHGKLSTAQQAMIAHARKLGHEIHVVRNIQDFLRLL